MKTRSLAVRCRRCCGERYVLPEHLPEDGYVCLRCRAVLAGRNAADPLVTEALAVQLARARAANAGLRRFPTANAAPDA